MNFYLLNLFQYRIVPQKKKKKKKKKETDITKPSRKKLGTFFIKPALLQTKDDNYERKSDSLFLNLVISKQAYFWNNCSILTKLQNDQNNWEGVEGIN